MPNIILMMHRKAIAQGLMKRLQGSSDMSLIYESNYHNAKATICRYDAGIALIEATESGPYDMNYCLTLCQQLRKHNPKCKLLLMCPEQDEESVKLVVDAKWTKQIDDFVFYDVSIDYLVSKLISF